MHRSVHTRSEANKMQPAIYILSNKPHGTLYIGVTRNLVHRFWQHKSRAVKGFTSKYNLVRLVYYEHTENIYVAIQREKQLKKWRREWKIHLIETTNPHWEDLSSTLY